MDVLNMLFIGEYMISWTQETYLNSFMLCHPLC